MLPLIQEIPYEDPIHLVHCFADQEWLCFLDSAKCSSESFSFIAFNPLLKITSKQGQVSVNNCVHTGNPFDILQQTLHRYKTTTVKNMPPFQGGAMGYFGYDLLHHLEKVPKVASDPLSFPDLMVGFYDTVIAVDHQKKQTWIIAHGFSEIDSTDRQQKAQQRCDFIVQQLAQKKQSPPAQPWSISNISQIKSNFTQAAYQNTIQKVIDYVHAGDIFQANIAQCFSCMLPEQVDGLSLYEKLRAKNPAPFSAFLHYDEITLASASPERFLKLTAEHLVETSPIKGTRKRGADLMEDQQLANELISSEKDRAENMMIVDLLRNDLSRVCLKNSVHVKKLCVLETFASVHHLVSTIEGTLSPKKDAIDLLRATFPGGSITGAPKIRAMEIIAECEPATRGPYCGSIGYIGFDGAMDTSIVIRTFALHGHTMRFHAGGGIVADSIPEEEYQETLTKASALMKVLLEQ